MGMKRQDLIKKLTDHGWRLLRPGGGHDIYTDGKRQEVIVRHNEIDEDLAKKILKRNGIRWRVQ
jgi:mRNA interferase HicA